ncbi:hypothetical protein LIER_08364 [Lithospermum erythrorhizon]|uniref:Reverse transcriptase zinc-binding domain-containing protein n=1 Tax=Lithospermum erythrorhizon TaxID=34254 RepID=A0AAV3PCV7_LITER
MECLRNLEECLGLMVSPTKSNIFLAGVRGIVRERILEGIGFEEGVFPVRYLGIPLVPMKVSDQDSYLMKRLIIIRDAIVRAYGSRERAISGLSKMVIGGRFASGKVYELLRVGRNKKSWMTTIWKNYIPPRFSFVVWLTCGNRLTTKDNLVLFDHPDRTCRFCKGPLESKQHIFFSCAVVGGIWM